MKKMNHVQRAWWSVLVLSAIAFPCHAELMLAHIAPMSGPVAAADGQAYNLGIRVALEAANARGGVLGQKIALKTLDDQYKPDRTVELINKEAAAGTLALLLPVGSASMTKVLKEKVLESVKMPIVGVIPGAEPLRTPMNPYLYHIRAGDLDQYRRIVEHTTTVGMKRPAVVYADIPFGKAGMAAVESLLKDRGVTPAAGLPFTLGPNIDFRGVIDRLRQAAPDVVVLISPPEPAGAFVREYHSAGLGMPIMTLSYGAAETMCAVAGMDKVKGVSVVQVVPNSNSPTLPISRRFRDDFKKYAPPDIAPTQNHFEAYITTQVLLEALKRAGSAPTREKLVRALDGMKEVDIGGFEVDFSPMRHTGSRFTDISIVSNNCKLVF
ncbi:MAG: ABC transporter substrate-binding protein [Rhodocyclaceae bacterium]|jgi:branched-chain amino acid transport system substrate-binding protein|nr:Leu/Ile/Val-binding protein [Rhodocyclaceae bacterium]MBZ0145217.1 ABC transporter substrate-binding protein [Rhodocyclaceae bacterium]MCL4680067.1 ABC transporter substrate-binding protein [Rhodocyclaceae bacterium]